MTRPPTLPPSAPKALPDATPPASTPQRRVTLAWSATDEAPGTLLVAFASQDRLCVDQHFGAATGFVLYAVDAQRARLVGVLNFPPSHVDGNEGKLPERIHGLSGCHAVYCLAVGGSAVRQLLAAGIQPLKLDAPQPIRELLLALSAAIRSRDLPWIARLLRAAPGERRFEQMLDEGWSE